MSNTDDQFNRFVRHYKKTCDACPALFEGTLTNGVGFYLRYRHGVALLGLEDGSPTVYKIIDRMADGSMDDSEFRETFTELFHQVVLDKFGFSTEDRYL